MDPEPYDSRPDTYAHIAVVRGYMLEVVRDLLYRAHDHDLSKLDPPEKDAFDEATPKLATTTYGSPEYEAARQGLGEALIHHYEHNRHHPEHFGDGIREMTLIDLLEMLADWKAATLRHADGDLGRSIEINAERFGYGEDLARTLRLTARELGWLEGWSCEGCGRQTDRYDNGVACEPCVMRSFAEHG